VPDDRSIAGLFPLGLVLNPGASLPLHIFEMRYRHLFNTAWDGNVKVRFFIRAGLTALGCDRRPGLLFQLVLLGTVS
jgi:Lon protease-like protein